jgi:hypothetical protein
MNTTMPIRQAIDHYLDQLSTPRLRFAAQVLAYLADQEDHDATQELLDIPGFLASFERGRQDLAQGRITSYEELRRKY